jgi:hypothetical protein
MPDRTPNWVVEELIHSMDSSGSPVGTTASIATPLAEVDLQSKLLARKG